MDMFSGGGSFKNFLHLLFQDKKKCNGEMYFTTPLPVPRPSTTRLSSYERFGSVGRANLNSQIA